MNNKLFLKVPSIDELDYRIKICGDKLTMDYNVGYGDNATGCYYINDEQARNWYNSWVSKIGNYYAYIIRSEDNLPVGEVNLHYDSKLEKYMIGIVIEACHRGKGYATIALELLVDKAFNEFGINELWNDFPKSRLFAEQVHKKIGFVRINEHLLVLKKHFNTKKDIKELK